MQMKMHFSVGLEPGEALSLPEYIPDGAGGHGLGCQEA